MKVFAPLSMLLFTAVGFSLDPNIEQLQRKYSKDHPIRQIQKHSRNYADLVEYLPGYRFGHMKYEMGSGAYSSVKSHIYNQYDYRYYNGNRINYHPSTWGIEPDKRKSGVLKQREPYPKKQYYYKIYPNRQLKLRESPFLF